MSTSARTLWLVALASVVGLVACATAPARVDTARAPATPTSAEAPTPAGTPAPVPPAEPGPVAPTAPARRAVTLGASGDVLVHLKVIRSAEENGGFRHVFGALSSLIGEDEIAFANLETPLSVRVPPETGDPPVLGTPPGVAAALAAAGIDVASVANNHAYDQTALGMEDTLRELDEAGVRAVGAAATDEEAPGPVVIERSGVRVAYLAFTERINRGPVARQHRARIPRFDRRLAQAALERARAQADVVVVSIHWSHDFVERPMIAQRELARFLVDAGADVIFGHGPHVLQEVERLESPRGDALCAYSLGNFVSNQGLRYHVGRRVPTNIHPAVVRPDTRDGAWLRVRVAVEERLRIEAVEAVPLWTHNNYVQVAQGLDAPLDIRIVPLSGAEEDVRAERRPFIERALGAAVTVLE